MISLKDYITPKKVITYTELPENHTDRYNKFHCPSEFNQCECGETSYIKCSICGADLCGNCVKEIYAERLTMDQVQCCDKCARKARKYINKELDGNVAEFTKLAAKRFPIASELITTWDYPTRSRFDVMDKNYIDIDGKQFEVMEKKGMNPTTENPMVDFVVDANLNKLCETVTNMNHLNAACLYYRHGWLEEEIAKEMNVNIRTVKNWIEIVKPVMEQTGKYRKAAPQPVVKPKIYEKYVVKDLVLVDDNGDTHIIKDWPHMVYCSPNRKVGFAKNLEGTVAGNSQDRLLYDWS